VVLLGALYDMMRQNGVKIVFALHIVLSVTFNSTAIVSRWMWKNVDKEKGIGFEFLSRNKILIELT
jgi:putative effector of murein hydrolase LrgA (UPF0299 family)